MVPVDPPAEKLANAVIFERKMGGNLGGLNGLRAPFARRPQRRNMREFVDGAHMENP